MATKRSKLESVCFEFYSEFHKGQQVSLEVIYKIIEGLPISFTKAMNDELTKPFTATQFFKIVENLENEWH